MDDAQLLVVDRTGLPLYELEQASDISATRVLWGSESSVGSIEFSMPPNDPKLAALGESILLQHELQLWYRGLLWQWAIPLDIPEFNRSTCRFSCVGLPWYYHQLIFGPIAVNYLLDPSFEDVALPNWTAANCTKESVVSPVVLGSRAMRLRAPTASDAFAYQRVTVAAGGDAPTRFFPAAHYFIDETVQAWTGPAIDERGLYVERQNPSTGAVIGEPAFYPIPNSAARSVPQRIEVSDGIEVPTAATERLEVRLYDPQGAIVWDASSLTVEESVGSNIRGDDASVILGRMNAYAQDAARGKFNLNIGFSSPIIGRTLRRFYQFKDVPNIGSSLNQYVAEGICDLAVRWAADGRSRWLEAFPGKRGTYRPEYGIDLTLDSLNDFSWSVAGRRTRTVKHSLGQGEGSDRETATARDTAFLGGLVLEDVESAPQETPIDGLAALAATDLARLKRLVRVPSVSVDARDYLGLTEGDTIPVRASFGIAQVNEAQRVQQLTLHPASNTLDVGIAHE